MTNRVLVVAAHPDDEILGCGASIARHTGEGDDVHVLILAEGITSRDETRDEALREVELSGLADAARAANAVLGVESLFLHSFPDNRMDSVDLLDVVKVVEAAVETHRPNVVYTHHPGDLNIDHRLVSEAVQTASRPVPGQCVDELHFFEVVSSTEWRTWSPSSVFVPNYFVDVTETALCKLEALQRYESELEPAPHARSIDGVEAQLRLRGLTAGVEYAEAFHCVRRLRRRT